MESTDQQNALQLDTAAVNNQGLDNWSEVRLAKANPERRSYHSSFSYDKKMFILGGLDINQGTMESLWSLDLACLLEPADMDYERS